MIKLENLTKSYQGEAKEAVYNLNLEINKGEICVFVGPSGCGKTTTLKMINRLIEPSSGNIYINGVNTAEQKKSELRRKIGYVIQEIGLFPHMTVRENIATVPVLLKWDQNKINKRVMELLKLIDLDADNNMDKYPHELSGGQQQRVGVARAMAADPPIMLMDEPFGAVDPITRAELQNEFLRLQKKINKTICFVTHDIDEAIKMGDKILIMNKGKMVQYDSPKNILFSPKNEFVEDFIGSDRALKVLNLIKVNEIMESTFEFASLSDDYHSLLKKIKKKEKKYLLITSDDKKMAGYVTLRSLEKNGNKDWQDYIKEIPVIKEDASLKDVFNLMLEKEFTIFPVVDKDNKLLARVTLDNIKSHISCEYQK
ncbi:ABC transporter ATP-binding protein [Halanaerobium hydrogeniformans]|uniref:Quaternary amine transport ATP-binding protein n=1 Tax=Halanaerobium hydrogeniformans TaxID=656519 RepID=E4RIY2_HALHG|nr:betaine/proline/choline family ABC transporter ATP-binding protein [Halanaerobium hydrogeniformans]ADQ15202.1 glycine betaine/L-proline ABC transporter, ATPase subunit [Halanaerobium hydrogeniformans]